MLNRVLEQWEGRAARSSGASKKAVRAFATSELVSLAASQTLRMYADPALYNAKSMKDVLAVQKKMEGSCQRA